MNTIYLDTETTGLMPGSICQIAMLEENSEHNLISATNHFFLVPECDKEMALKTSEITGLTPEILEELSGGQLFKHRAPELFTKLSNKTLVAHNISFDTRFIQTEMSRNGLDFQPASQLDTMSIFTPICALPKSRGAGHKKPKLEELVNHYGLSEDAIIVYASELFGTDFRYQGYHDARFDVTAMYICCRMRAEELSGGYGPWAQRFKAPIVI